VLRRRVSFSTCVRLSLCLINVVIGESLAKVSTNRVSVSRTLLEDMEAGISPSSEATAQFPWGIYVCLIANFAHCMCSFKRRDAYTEGIRMKIKVASRETERVRQL